MYYFIYKLYTIPSLNRVSLAFYIISTLCVNDLFGFVCRLCITCIFYFNIKGNKIIFPWILITLHPAICFHVHLVKTITTKLINQKYNSVCMLRNTPFSEYAYFCDPFDMPRCDVIVVNSNQMDTIIDFDVFRALLNGCFHGRNQCQGELLFDVPM